MVAVAHDETSSIFTNNSIGIKIMAVFFMVMTMCFFIMIVIVIMCWTWCYWRFTSQMILSCLNLLRCQILLKEVMIVVAMSHDKSCRIFTDNSICIKPVIMVFTMMVVMLFFIVIIMRCTWCCRICPFQVILSRLNLVCCQIFLKEVMIVVAMSHDKTF